MEPLTMPPLPTQTLQGPWFQVTVKGGGTEWVPFNADTEAHLDLYVEGEIHQVNYHEDSWGARQDSHGAPWTAGFDSEQDALDYLNETYPDKIPET